MIGFELLDLVGADGAILAVELGGTLLETGDENVLSTEQVVPLLAGIFFLAGGYLLYEARDPFVQAFQYLTTSSFDPSTSADEDGPVVVRGTVEPAEATVTAPLSGEECVAYVHREQTLEHDRRRLSWREKERARRIGQTSNATEGVREWSTRTSERERVPFRVETEAGSVAVDPDGARIDMSSRTVDEPSVLRRALAYVPVVRFFTDLEREVESSLAPGDRVLVVGEVERGDSPGVVGVFASGEEAEVLVTSKSRWRLAGRHLAHGLFSAVLPFVLLAMAIAIVVIAFSVGVYE